MTIVLTHPRQLTDTGVAILRAQLDDWEASGRDTPLVLQEGMQVSTIGGLHFRFGLSEGPLDGVRFEMDVPRLSDLPASFAYADGEYRLWRSEDGRQMVTMDGDPCYRWEPNP